MPADPAHPAFPLPSAAALILRRLEQAGFEAWAVGGCVRDCLLGLAPQDWDICTSARPEEVVAAFHGCKTIPTGMRHGTVTVLLKGTGWEVTTYRADSGYSDHRRPDRVRFLNQVEGDLARRDFTVNAMAWHPDRGLFDPMGGQKDLKQRTLRCVGDPALRFGEDALRILRGVRFAARYGLTPHPDTAAAIHRKKEDLAMVAPERCFAELRRLLLAPGEGLGPVLREFWDVLTVLPGLAYLAPMAGYDQQNPHHHLDLREHTIQAVTAVRPEEGLRLAALLHDGGKPACRTVVKPGEDLRPAAPQGDERPACRTVAKPGEDLRSAAPQGDEKPACRTVDGEGVAHYYGHPAKGAALAARALAALRCPKGLRRRVIELVELHDLWAPPTPAAARRWLGRLGEERLRDLLELQRADTLAHAPHCQPARLRQLERWRELLDEVLAEERCFSLRDLAVNGNDILALGVPPGPRVGETLRHLLEQVVEGKLENYRETLLAEIRRDL